jgi:hypothetical protein
VVCLAFGFSIDTLGIPLAIFVMLLPFANLDDTPIADAPGFAIKFCLTLPVYVVKQFVLGFPDREKIILTPRSYDIGQERTSTQSAEVADDVHSANATVITPLKPYGFIAINGERMEAISVDGTLIDIGQNVQVCGRRNSILVVKQTATGAARHDGPS